MLKTNSQIFYWKNDSINRYNTQQTISLPPVCSNSIEASNKLAKNYFLALPLESTLG